MSDDEYEYDYSDGDEDDYVVEDMDDDGQAGMDWTGTDNPQTPTTISGVYYTGLFLVLMLMSMLMLTKTLPSSGNLHSFLPMISFL
jgi:hypothetical protein